jgi:gluconokinase
MNSVFIFMGVSGCGKSTVSEAFALKQKIEYFDADDFHSDSAKAHMQSGKALSDAMRQPWIARIINHLQLHVNNKGSCSLAYSGLRAAQRQTLLTINANVIYFHLVISQNDVTKRLQSRKGHFFPAELVQSQFDSLEPPGKNEQIIEIDATQNLEAILHDIQTFL